MMRGSDHRRREHAAADLFVDRWSPRAMSGEDVAVEDLMVLFEAARWAPSAFNNQPWRMLYARRGTAPWPLFLDLLSDANKTWCATGAALVLFVSKTTFDKDGAPSRTHSFDTGAAWENLALQGTLMGLVVHAMQGFDYDRARAALAIPADYQVEAMVVIGRPGRREALPPHQQEREFPKGRRPLAEIVGEGPFRF
jgi:nitroreductase